MKRNRKAKILATLGPASSSSKVIENLFTSGCDVFRLNFSHGSIEDQDFIKMIKEVTSKVNKKLSVIEQIRKFILTHEEFTIENNLMTPTMKVKRFKVKNIFGDKLEKLY